VAPDDDACKTFVLASDDAGSGDFCLSAILDDRICK
jgi:hypothetical protein